MSAGFPGLGLGGLFTIIAALIRGVVSVALVALGRGSRDQAAKDAGHAAVALMMIVAGVASWFLLLVLFDLRTVRILGIAPVYVPFLVLMAVVGSAKVLDLLLSASGSFRRVHPRGDDHGPVSDATLPSSGRLSERTDQWRPEAPEPGYEPAA